MNIKINIKIEKRHFWGIIGVLVLLFGITAVIAKTDTPEYTNDQPFHETLYADKIAGKGGTLVTVDDNLKVNEVIYTDTVQGKTPATDNVLVNSNMVVDKILHTDTIMAKIPPGMVTVDDKLKVNNIFYTATIIGNPPGLVTVDDNVLITKNLNVRGDLNVVGTTGIGWLKVDKITGNTDITKVLVDASLEVKNDLKVGGKTEVVGKLTADDEVEVKGKLTADDEVEVKGKLTADDEVEVKGKLTADGNAKVVGDVEAGTITLGNVKRSEWPIEMPVGFCVFSASESSCPDGWTDESSGSGKFVGRTIRGAPGAPGGQAGADWHDHWVNHGESTEDGGGHHVAANGRPTTISNSWPPYTNVRICCKDY